MVRYSLPVLLMLILLTGCSRTESDESVQLKTPGDQLSEEELRKFLTVVENMPSQAVPEFSPESLPDLDYRLAPEQLTAAYRERFRRLFDPSRQGTLWRKKTRISKAAKQAELSTDELAALIRSLSCAVVRHQLGPERDLTRARQDAQELLEEICESLNEVNSLSETAKNIMVRENLGIRLGRVVALQEFLILLEQVPEENLELVRKFEKELSPLIPERPSPDQDPIEMALDSLGETRG